LQYRADKHAILAILQANPAAASENHGEAQPIWKFSGQERLMPLHVALSSECVCLEVVKALLAAHPGAASQRSCGSWRKAFHLAVCNHAHPDIVLAVLTAFPQVLKEPFEITESWQPEPVSIGMVAMNFPAPVPDEVDDDRPQWTLAWNAFVAVVCHGYSAGVVQAMQSLAPEDEESPLPREDLCAAASMCGTSRQLILDQFQEGVCPHRMLQRIEAYVKGAGRSFNFRLKPFLEALHLNGFAIIFEPETLISLCTVMNLEGIHCVVQAGVTTQGCFVEADKRLCDRIRTMQDRQSSFYSLCPSVRPNYVDSLKLLRAWHRGESIYKKFLELTFRKVLPPIAAFTVSDMFAGSCLVEGCSCHVFAASIRRDDMAKPTPRPKHGKNKIPKS